MVLCWFVFSQNQFPQGGRLHHLLCPVRSTREGLEIRNSDLWKAGGFFNVCTHSKNTYFGTQADSYAYEKLIRKWTKSVFFSGTKNMSEGHLMHTILKKNLNASKPSEHPPQVEECLKV